MFREKTFQKSKEANLETFFKIIPMQFTSWERKLKQLQSSVNFKKFANCLAY